MSWFASREGLQVCFILQSGMNFIYATAPVSYTECLRLETVVHELFMRLELNCCAYCAKLFVLSVYMKLTTANEAEVCSYKNTPVLP